MSHDPTIRENYELSKEPTGFANRTDSTITFDDASRTLTIAPVGDHYEVFLQGVLHRKYTTSTVTIDDLEGLWYIYFNTAGQLVATQTFSITFITDFAFVSLLYWDATHHTAIYVADERHGFKMDGATQAYLHNSVGAAYVSGFSLGNFTFGAGNSASDAQLSVSPGTFYDEDIVHAIVDGSPQTLSTAALLPVFYREGSEGFWRKKAATSFPVITSSEAGLDGNRLAYNWWNSTAWQQASVDNNGFTLIHVFATNNISEPIIAVQGNNQYGNIPAARAAAPTEISTLSGLPFVEAVPLGSVIYQTADGYTNTVHARVRQTDTGADYVDLRQISTLPVNQVNDHGNLSGLTDLDHPATAIRVDTTNFNGNLSTADTTVQAALDTLDNLSIAAGVTSVGLHMGSTALTVSTDGGATFSQSGTITSAGTFRLGGTLAPANGGTGLTSYAAGDLVYASSSSALAKLAGAGATGQVLLSGVSAPSWGKVGLTTHVTGALLATNGGSGQSVYSQGDMLYSATIAPSSLSKLSIGASNTVLTSTGSAPAWAQLNLATAVTGTLPVGNGGTGATSFSFGGVLFGNGTSAISTDSSYNIYWDNTNKRLGVAVPATFTALLTIGSSTISITTSAPCAIQVSWNSGLPAGSVSVITDTASSVVVQYGGLTGTTPTGTVFANLLNTNSSIVTAATATTGGASTLPATGTYNATAALASVPSLVSSFNVGTANSVPGFQVSSVGDIVAIRGVATTFPSANASGVLTNNGSGTLSWSAVNINTGTTGVLAVANGGTNLSSYTIGDIIYASGTTTLSKLADVATGNALISGGVGAAPSWGKIGLTTHVNGTLPVANGGTGAGTFTQGSVVFAGASGQYSQNNSNLFWDNTSSPPRLGIGTPTPITVFDVLTTTRNLAYFRTSDTGTSNQIAFLNGSNSWAGVIGTVSGTGLSSGDVFALGVSSAPTSLDQTPVLYWTPNGVTSINAAPLTTASIPFRVQQAVFNDSGIEFQRLSATDFAIGSYDRTALAPTAMTLYASGFAWDLASPDAMTLTSGGSLLVFTTTNPDSARLHVSGGGITHTSSQFNARPGSGLNYEWVNRDGTGHTWYVNSAATQAMTLTSAGALQVLVNDATIYGITVGRGGGGINSNSALGYLALSSNTVLGTENTGLGHRALDANISGSRNTAVGCLALTANTTEADSTGVGFAALTAATGGISTTAVGSEAVRYYINPKYCVAVGYQAMNGGGTNITGTVSNNVAVGAYALKNVVTSGNVAVGANALTLLNSAGVTSGSLNTAVGFDTLKATTNGVSNTAVGANALKTLAAASVAGESSNNTAVGGSAAAVLTTGYENVAIGFQALESGTSAYHSIAVGFRSLTEVTSGYRNTGIGRFSGSNITTGFENIAIGDYALGEAYASPVFPSNVTGNNNIAIGTRSLGQLRAAGSNNIALGENALGSANTGTTLNNVAVGYLAGNNLISGATNVVIGYNAHCGGSGGVTGGDQNTVVGATAGALLTTGDNNTFIGYGASCASGSGAITNATAIGNGALVNASNKIRLGNTSVLILSCSQSLTVESDARDKTDIEPLPEALPIIADLRPVKYRWDKRVRYPNGVPDGSKKDAAFTGGFLAQELRQTRDAHSADWLSVVDESDPEYLGVTHEKLIPVIVKALQELATKAAAAESRADAAEARLAALEAAVAALQST